MKIKKILGLILFVFVCVLALASCKKGNFEVKYYDRTYSGDLYVEEMDNYYILISGDKIYEIEVTKAMNTYNGMIINEVNVVRIDDYTWKYNNNYFYYVLINNGQELLFLSSRGQVTFYIKTDHIEGLQEG